ncbi:MAG: SGNH/GDSL hydrolase family protein, partial [Pseudomonadota bacterium]
MFVSVWAAAAHAQDARIQLLGDSLMAWHSLTGRSIPNVLSRQLGERVDSRAVSGAMIRGIARQYRSGDYEWVVLNGGGNDLWLGCGCTQCEGRMAQIISRDGSSGRLP